MHKIEVPEEKLEVLLLYYNISNYIYYLGHNIINHKYFFFFE
jgi:hypothetical protein